MHRIQRNILVIVLVVILSIASQGGRSLAHAQSRTLWEPPQWIPGLVDTTPSQYPVFVTDSMGKVHLFHSQWLGDSYSIFYSQWAAGVGWTQPVDVFMPTWGQARVFGAFLDSTGMFHVFYWGGDETGASIFTIQAPMQQASKATAWSRAKMIGANAIVPTTAAVISDGNGAITVVYSGNTDGNGLYSSSSSDFGDTWSKPTLFFSTGSDTLWSTELKLALSADKRVHAAWALGDSTGNSRAIYYARFEPDKQTWSHPRVLAEAINYEADTPSIIEYKGSLMVIYHNDFPTTRWMIRSFDGGETWTAPTRLFEQVGSNGAAALVIDSSDTLHMFFGNRVGEPATHGLWHSTWLGSSWSIPEPVVSGPHVMIGPNGEEGFDPSYAQVAISRGNLLLVVWRHDPTAGPTHIWYSFRYLNAPQLPAETVPAPVPTATQVLETALPSFTPVSPVSTFADDFPAEGGSEEINKALATGIGPALILIIIIIVLVRRKH
jgi:hypothetical protein